MANVKATNSLLPNEVHPNVNPGLKTYMPVAGSELTTVPTAKLVDSNVNNYPPPYSVPTRVGVKATSFKNDFYFKIRYLPGSLNLGSLTGDQNRDLYVFNGFFDNRVLNSISLVNGEGIAIGGPSTPSTSPPLNLQLYPVSVTVDGPATIDASINFDWQAPTVDGTVLITGSRIVAFPYIFSPGTTETLKWSTEVLTKFSGKEQRIRTRNAPRQGFSVSAFIPRGQLTIVDNLLYGWRGNTWGVPIFSECRQLTSPTTTASAVIQADTNFSEFRVGELAIVFESVDKFELVQISSFNTTSITTSQNISQVFSTRAFVVPVLPCRMTSNPTRNTNASVGQIQASFESVDNRVLPTTNSDVQYKGYDVYLEAPLRTGRYLSDSYDTRVDVLDYVSPNVQTFNVWDNTKVTRQFEVEMRSLEELWNFRLFLHRRSGRLRPFWMPTFENNVRLVSTGLLQTTFEVVDENQGAQGQDRKHLALLKTDGVWIFSEIQTIVTSSIIGQLTVTLTSPLNIQDNEIELISYMGLKRLASDTVEITHGANFVSVCQLSVIEIEP